jgi:hypothetical protein
MSHEHDLLLIANLVHDAPRDAVDPESNPVQVAPDKLATT